jgi:multidrug efflux pump subunit AcrA (membrane-fusion protein)
MLLSRSVVSAVVLSLILALALDPNGAAAAVNPEAKKIPAVQALKVEPVDIAETLVYPARVESRVEATLLSDANGIVRDMANLGSPVKRGQKVMIIQQTDPIYQYSPFKVTSPVNGVISELFVSAGSRVSKDQKLATLIDPAHLQLSIEVASADLGQLKVGDRGTLTLPHRDEKAAVVVDALSPVVSPQTGTATAVLKFMDPKDQARTLAGSLGQVEFKLALKKGIMIPESAIVYRGPLPFVRLVENDTVKYRAVTLGQRQKGQYEILKGLADNDVVVQRSSQFLGDNQKVIVQLENAKATEKTADKPTKKSTQKLTVQPTVKLTVPPAKVN